jgi:hypothetical protein
MWQSLMYEYINSSANQETWGRAMFTLVETNLLEAGTAINKEFASGETIIVPLWSPN